MINNNEHKIFYLFQLWPALRKPTTSQIISKWDGCS